MSTRYDTTFDLTVPDGATEVSSAPIEIPVGVTCTVTEGPVPDGWGLTGTSPEGGTVTIVEGTSEVTVTNTRTSGALLVSKVAAGDATGTTPVFTVQVNCDQRLQRNADARRRRMTGPTPS